MKFRGLIRRIDELGRITIPMEYRKELGLKGGDEIVITRFENGVKVIKATESDISTRVLDKLGRVVISKKTRKMLEMEELEELEMFLLEEDAIYIRKVKRNE